MNIIEQIENEIRQNPNFGVKFSIDADAYKCRLGDRVSFGENTTALQCGSFYNYQDILLDEKIIGYLEEIDDGRLFRPMVSSFIIPIADCSEEKLWEQKENEFADNPHLHDAGEVLELRFATLNQMLDFLNAA